MHQSTVTLAGRELRNIESCYTMFLRVATIYEDCDTVLCKRIFYLHIPFSFRMSIIHFFVHGIGRPLNQSQNDILFSHYPLHSWNMLRPAVRLQVQIFTARLVEWNLNNLDFRKLLISLAENIVYGPKKKWTINKYNFLSTRLVL